MVYKEDEEDVNKEVGRARRVGVFDFGTGRHNMNTQSDGCSTLQIVTLHNENLKELRVKVFSIFKETFNIMTVVVEPLRQCHLSRKQCQPRPS